MLPLWELTFTSGLKESLSKSLTISLATVDCTHQWSCISAITLWIRIISTNFPDSELLGCISFGHTNPIHSCPRLCAHIYYWMGKWRECFNEMLSSSLIELEISGVPSLQLLTIVHLWKLKSCIIGNIHWPHALFTVIKKHLLQAWQPLNDGLTFCLALYL